MFRVELMFMKEHYILPKSLVSNQSENIAV